MQSARKGSVYSAEPLQQDCRECMGRGAQLGCQTFREFSDVFGVLSFELGLVDEHDQGRHALCNVFCDEVFSSWLSWLNIGS